MSFAAKAPFTAKDLRYNLEKYYPVLASYLRQRAERALGGFGHDTEEVELVVGHVVDHLVCVGLLGGGDHAPETEFDRMTTPQFYKFLNQSIKNKAIDRWRKRKLLVSTVADLQAPGEPDEEYDPLNQVTEPVWGEAPFATPEDFTLELASQEELRDLLKKCIEALLPAARQFQAMLLELKDFGALELLEIVLEDVQAQLPPADTPLANLSQHKDHAHKKLRLCVQKRSTNLIMQIVSRLMKYGISPPGIDQVSVTIEVLAQDDLSEQEVQFGLKHLVYEGFLNWRGEHVVHLTVEQLKRLSRFYERE